MLPARTFPLLQQTLARRNPHPEINQHTLQAIHSYVSGMTASIAAYKRDIETLFAEYFTQTSALLAMQQKYIIDKDALHQQHTQELITSFHLRYEQLEAQLTTEQMRSFTRQMQEAHAGLDIWDDANDSIGACSTDTIHAFMQDDPAEDVPNLTFPGDIH